MDWANRSIDLMQLIAHRMMFEIIANHFYDLWHAAKVDIRSRTGLARGPIEHRNHIFFLKRDFELKHVQEGFTHFPPHLPCVLILATIGLERVLIEPCQHCHDNHTLRLWIRILKPHTQS